MYTKTVENADRGGGEMIEGGRSKKKYMGGIKIKQENGKEQENG